MNNKYSNLVKKSKSKKIIKKKSKIKKNSKKRIIKKSRSKKNSKKYLIKNKKSRKKHMVKSKSGGFIPEAIQNKILAIGEIHDSTKVSLQTIIDECKNKKDYKFYIFSEMELKDNIRHDKNVTIIPEMVLIPEKDEENVKCAMSFLVNTFFYMKKVLEILFQFKPGNKEYNTYNECKTLLLRSYENLIPDIETYLDRAGKYRLRKEYFTGERYMPLYESLNNFYKNYKTGSFDFLKKQFDTIIDICIENKIFEPILDLTPDYKEIGKNKVDMINPFKNTGEKIAFDDETKYDIEKGEYIFGWPFLIRDMLHSNRIESYINNNILPGLREKSIYIVHKGLLHFQFDKNENPIRYAININFKGHDIDMSVLKKLINNLKIHDGKLIP